MPPTRDPRYRPYRFALWITYFLAIALSIGLVVANIVRHLSGPHRPQATGALPTRATVRVCVGELEALHQEQNERAWRLSGQVGAQDALAAFDAWAREWERRVDDLSERCRLDASDPDPQGFGGREELARARDSVLALHRAYRAQVNRFALEGAELARGADRALEAARQAATPQR
ncbi:MAG: hypothetical protein IPO09_07190 [Anaeromyxobacter sp.]|nr:hypothetical protein [Anaeromyxobacter sp.]MBL0277963.1 hypothetical protein [Anaeromyxobacter sp.]